MMTALLSWKMHIKETTRHATTETANIGQWMLIPVFSGGAEEAEDDVDSGPISLAIISWMVWVVPPLI